MVRLVWQRAIQTGAGPDRLRPRAAGHGADGAVGRELPKGLRRHGVGADAGRTRGGHPVQTVARTPHPHPQNVVATPPGRHSYHHELSATAENVAIDDMSSLLNLIVIVYQTSTEVHVLLGFA